MTDKQSHNIVEISVEQLTALQFHLPYLKRTAKLIHSKGAFARFLGSLSKRGF